MKVSVIISVYRSYGAIARQVSYWRGLQLPPEVEFILVDDGSEPALDPAHYALPNLQVVYTHNKLAWTQGLGRNLGASVATGELLLMTDIDHIISAQAFHDALYFTGSRMIFPRYLGMLDEVGTFSCQPEDLLAYGIDPRRALFTPYQVSFHTNTFALKRSIFAEIGGYDEQYSLYGFHPVSRAGDDCHFNSKVNRYARKHGIECALGAPIYVFPNGRFHKDKSTNPWGLWHNLSYDGQRVTYKGEEDG